MRTVLVAATAAVLSGCSLFTAQPEPESASVIKPRLKLTSAMPTFPVSLAPAAASQLGCAVPNAPPPPPQRFRISSSLRLQGASTVPAVAPAMPTQSRTKAAAGKSFRASSEQAIEDAMRAAGEALSAGDGLTAEAEYRRVLELDASQSDARVALAALLMDADRRSEAQEVVSPGLRQSPRNSSLKMLQARLWTAAGADGQALDLLLRDAPSMTAQADYHGLAAALEQRLGRHAAAAARYRQLTQLRPNEGSWWVGLGISEEALGRPLAARDAFNRARGSGRLTPVLDEYAARRLAALSPSR